MGTITLLRPRDGQAGAARLLAEVEQAVAAGVDLGDRRTVLGALTSDLRGNYLQLRSALADLRALGGACDPETAGRIAYCEDICAELLDQFKPVLPHAAQPTAQLRG